jgi:hypothetical protein
MDVKLMAENEKDLIMSLTLAKCALSWWEEHKEEEPFIYWFEPEFVKLAKELING